MKDSRDEVRSIKRALEILEILRIEKEPMSLAFLHKALCLPKTTLARILNTLEAEGFVERDATLQKYTLGIKFFYYGHAVSEKLTDKKMVSPVLQRIRDISMETVYIYLLYKNRRICVDYLPGKNAVRVMTYLGDESPLYVGAAGKAILAYFTEESLQEYLMQTKLEPITPSSIVNRDLLVEELKLIRNRGYAISIGEIIPGVISASAPLMDGKGLVRGSLAIAAPMERQSEIELYIKLVVEGAAEINKYHALKL